MKNTEKTLDEIIFEKRNKDYGAYALRKSYSKNMIRAMVISFTLFLMGVSIPLIASYMSEEKYVNEKKEVEIKMDRPKNKVVIKMPEAPKPIEKKAPAYRPPVVTSNPDDVTDELDDLMNKTVNTNIGDTIGNTVVIPEVSDDKKPLDDDEGSTPPTIVSEMPEFPGGDVARIKFFSENIKYPIAAREIGVQGPVYFTFVVEKDGSISNIKMLRGIGAGCDEEALRVVSMMPKWKPGRQNGREVRVQFNLPISFVLK
jgi:periplasmic protein TonB